MSELMKTLPSDQSELKKINKRSTILQSNQCKYINCDDNHVTRWLALLVRGISYKESEMG